MKAHGGGISDKVHTGPIHSSVAGRTDHLPMHVPSGAYVIPADIISAMGEGNTMAGFKVAKELFETPEYAKGTPGQLSMNVGPNAIGDQAIPNLPHKASGGSVPIVAAGGEYVIHPDHVTRIGNGNIDHGHKILDHFVKKMRKKTVETLKKLPGPKKD